MVHTLCTVSFQGIQAVLVEVQVQFISGSLPGLNIVGLPDRAVNEAKERIRAALQSIGVSFPCKRITINLSPANILKEGSHYDLPLALGMLMGLEILPAEICHSISLGELSLDGSLKPVSGVLSSALLASSLGKTLICPGICGSEARWGGDGTMLAPNHLLDLVNHFKGTQVLTTPELTLDPIVPCSEHFGLIHGQEHAKWGLIVSIAGGHNALMVGPPGTGKSFLAKSMMSLLDPLTPQEALEVTMIHSLSGLLKEGKGLMRQRPFRAPHHSASMPSIVGGGLKGVPGEISLAHNGILFLDELPEFSRHVLDALRQSMETREAVVSRANYHVVYPANFQLIAAMNPCKCGYLGKASKECRQAPECSVRYQTSLSGPLLDRIDVFMHVSDLDFKNIPPPTRLDDLSLVQSMLSQAKCIQEKRYEALNIKVNAQCPSNILDAALEKVPEVKALLLKAASHFEFSMRGFYRVARVAQTIADLEGEEQICPRHMTQALSYRTELLSVKRMNPGARSLS
jgi:magnesium chelatase family protein